MTRQQPPACKYLDNEANPRIMTVAPLRFRELEEQCMHHRRTETMYDQQTLIDGPRPRLPRGGLVTASYLCEVTGVKYRQLDYWIRLGVVTPAQPADGSGTNRGFTAGQVPIIQALGQLQVMGASADQLRAVFETLTTYAVADWHGYLYVGPAGRVSRKMNGPVALVLNLDQSRPTCIAWNCAVGGQAYVA